MHDILNLVKDYDYRYLTPYPSIVGTFNEAGYQTVFILGSDKKFAHIDSFIKNAGSKNIWTEIKLLRVTNGNIRSTTGASPTMTCMPR